jgi:hypothetical protein
MKKLISKIYLISACLFLINIAAYTQNTGITKSDKITFLNGEIKEGKVLAFVDNMIRFVYEGETLRYEFSKGEIKKIEYSSGRIEVFAHKEMQATQQEKIVSKNRVAVIPIQYAGYGNAERGDDMKFYLQEIAASYLAKSAVELNIMDVADINAVLLKNGAIDSNIRRYTPKELALMLNAEYILMGTVIQDNGTLVTRATINKSKNNDWWDNGEHKRDEKFHQLAVTNQMVETSVTLSIYNESGERLYSKSRNSMLSERDAYKNTIRYLLKRTILYKR